MAPAARRRHASGARGGGAAREARARARRGGMSGRLKTNGRNGSGRGQTYARPGICTRIDARVGARREQPMGNTVGWRAVAAAMGNTVGWRARARRRRRVRGGRAGVGGSLGKKYTLGVSITAPRGASVRP